MTTWAELYNESRQGYDVITTPLPPCPYCGRCSYGMTRQMTVTYTHIISGVVILGVYPPDTESESDDDFLSELICRECRMLVGTSIYYASDVLNHPIAVTINDEIVIAEDALFKMSANAVVEMWERSKYFDRLDLHPQHKPIFRNVRQGEFKNGNRCAWSCDGNTLIVLSLPPEGAGTYTAEQAYADIQALF